MHKDNPMPLRPLVALVAVFSACLASLSGATAKPNIVYILADDLGFAELGCNGADRYKTPHIDALAALLERMGVKA